MAKHVSYSSGMISNGIQFTGKSVVLEVTTTCMKLLRNMPKTLQKLHYQDISFHLQKY